MSLEPSLFTGSPIGTATALDTSPALTTYLLACDAEGKSEQTIKTYKQRITRLLRHAGKPETDVVTNDILLFLHDLRQLGSNPSTVNAYYRAIHTYFEWCITWKVIKISPMNGIKAPRYPKKQPVPYSLDELRALMLTTSGERFLDLRNRAMTYLFLETGMRLDELARLKVSDMDLKTGIIKVFGKGAKERQVVIQKETRKALLRYLLNRTDTHTALWISEERQPMTRDGVRVTISKMCERAGIKGNPHKFRHTAAIHCLRNGMGVFTLQRMLGHSTLAMTRRYADIVNEDLIREHKKASPVDNLKL